METQQPQTQEQTKKCPKCKEEIKIDAVICKHCGNKLDLGSKISDFGNNLTRFGCALTIIVIAIIILLGLL